MRQSTLKRAFINTIPILAGYLVLGMGFGILMTINGYGILWTLLCSVFIFAGSMQYVTVTLFTTAFNPVYTFVITLVINARHIFYGISMLKKYAGAGKIKPYLIFGLTDETFSLLGTSDDGMKYALCVTLLDHLYWVMGSLLGAALGYVITFNTRGLDFALTALFVVIFVEQWKNSNKHLTAIIGVVCSAICLALFGANNFILPAMAFILITLTLLKNRLSAEVST